MTDFRSLWANKDLAETSVDDLKDIGYTFVPSLADALLITPQVQHTLIIKGYKEQGFDTVIPTTTKNSPES